MTANKRAGVKKQGAGVKQASSGKKLKGGVDPSVGKATQFKPGQSGNPAGAKPGTKHLTHWIQELVTDPNFEAKVVDPKTLQIVEFKGAPIKAIIQSLIHISMTHPDHKTRMQAMDMIMGRGWSSKTEITGEDGAPLTPIALDSTVLTRVQVQHGAAPSGSAEDRG